METIRADTIRLPDGLTHQGSAAVKQQIARDIIVRNVFFWSFFFIVIWQDADITCIRCCFLQEDDIN